MKKLRENIEIVSDANNVSGLKFAKLNSASPIDVGSKALWVDATGNVVVADTAWIWAWVAYVTDPVSIGAKILFSVWVNADLIDESVIGYTWGWTPTINMGGVTTTGIQNFDSNYVSNYDWSEFNYTQITQNFNDTPIQISCEVAPTFATAYTAAALTQYAEIIVEYDNTVDPLVTKTIKTLFDGTTQVIPFITPTDSGEITVSWATGDVTVTITGWTPGYFAFAAADPICYYNGVSVNNYTNKIHIHNGDITENTNTTETNVWVTEVYDNTSTTVHNGTQVFNNLTVLWTFTGWVTTWTHVFGDGSDGDLIVPAGTTNLLLDKVYNYNNIIISAWATVSSATPGGAMQIKCLGTMTLDGDIDLTGLGQDNSIINLGFVGTELLWAIVGTWGLGGNWGWASYNTTAIEGFWGLGWILGHGWGWGGWAAAWPGYVQPNGFQNAGNWGIGWTPGWVWGIPSTNWNIYNIAMDWGLSAWGAWALDGWIWANAYGVDGVTPVAWFGGWGSGWSWGDRWLNGASIEIYAVNYNGSGNVILNGTNGSDAGDWGDGNALFGWVNWGCWGWGWAWGWGWGWAWAFGFIGLNSTFTWTIVNTVGTGWLGGIGWVKAAQPAHPFGANWSNGAVGDNGIQGEVLNTLLKDLM